MADADTCSPPDGRSDTGVSPTSLRGLDSINFLMADVRDGVGPYLSVFLSGTRHWSPGGIGMAMAASILAAAVCQIPAGLLVDATRLKRLIVALSGLFIGGGCLLIVAASGFWPVLAAQAMLGAASAIIPPAIAALSLGIVGRRLMPDRISRNESFNHAGSFIAAALAGAFGQYANKNWIFYLVCAFAVASAVAVMLIDPCAIDHDAARGGESPDRHGQPITVKTLLTRRTVPAFLVAVFLFLMLIDPCAIDHDAARGGESPDRHGQPITVKTLLTRRTVPAFLVAVFLFHFGNAAMLPFAGQVLAKTHPKSDTICLSACIICAQLVMVGVAWAVGRAMRGGIGRKPIFLVALLLLPIRGVLFSVVANPVGIVAIQMLDGVAAGIFGVIAVMIAADLTHGTGRFNLMQGLVALSVGIGASCSNLAGGAIVQRFGYRTGFFSLAAIACCALVFFLMMVPETRDAVASRDAGDPQPDRTNPA